MTNWKELKDMPKDGKFLITWEFIVMDRKVRSVAEGDYKDVEFSKAVHGDGQKAIAWDYLPAPYEGVLLNGN